MSSSQTSDRWKLPTVGDLALAGSLLIVAVLSGLYVDGARPDTIAPATWWHWLLLCTPSALVAIRRIEPLVVTALAAVAQSAVWISDLPDVLLPVIVILYTAASEGGTRGRLVAVASSAVLTAVTAVGVQTADDVTVYQVPLIALTCGTAVVLGVIAANQRAAAGELAAAVTEAEIRAEHAREQAVAEERSHIGRELHDIIGHSLSVIAVRAEAADRVADRQPDAARSAVADIAGAARSALSETRRILSGLQRSSSAELAPPPDLAAITSLVDELARTGVAVSMTAEGCAERPPPAVVAGGIYRIVQESLTNAIKHGGPGVQIEASLRCSTTSIDVEIVNTVADRSDRSDGVGGARGGDDASPGLGLAGMAERVRVLGGSFDAGRRSDHRFAVVASLPASVGDGSPSDRPKEPTS